MTNALYGALLAAASVSPAAARQSGPAALWVWPVDPPVVTRAFVPPPTPYAAGHRGIDLAAVTGQPVEAAGAGVVSFAGQVAGTGVVVVRHGDLRTTYEPVTPMVNVGQIVEAGRVIGHVSGGHLGCTVCLHFGLRRGLDYLDPMLLFRRGPVRLLPVDGPPPAAVGEPGVALMDSADIDPTVNPAASQLGSRDVGVVAAPASRRTDSGTSLPSPAGRRSHLSLVPPLPADAADGAAVAAVAAGAVITGSAVTRRRSKRRAPSP